MTRSLAWRLSSLLIALPLGGCMTQALVETIEDLSPNRPRTVEAYAIERAVRGGDGAYYLATRYDDGSLRGFVVDPSPRARDPLQDWPPTGGRADLSSRPTLELPKGPDVQILRRFARPGPGAALRLRDGWLELYESGRPRKVAAFPPRALPRQGRSVLSTCGQAGLALLVPVTLAGDTVYGAVCVLAVLGGLESAASWSLGQ